MAEETITGAGILRIKPVDYFDLESDLLARLGVSPDSVEGADERTELVNALVLEMQQPGVDPQASAARALSRFRVAVLRQSGETTQLLQANAIAQAMVVVAQMWVKRLLEQQAELLRQQLRDQGHEPVV